MGTDRDESGMDIFRLSVRPKRSNSNQIYIRIPVRYSDSLIGHPISVSDNVPDTWYGYGMPSIRRISDIQSDIYSNTRVIIRGHKKTCSKIAYELYFGRSVGNKLLDPNNLIWLFQKYVWIIDFFINKSEKILVNT